MNETDKLQTLATDKPQTLTQTWNRHAHATNIPAKKPSNWRGGSSHQTNVRTPRAHRPTSPFAPQASTWARAGRPPRSSRAAPFITERGQPGPSQQNRTKGCGTATEKRGGLHNTIQQNTTQHNTIQYDTIHDNTIQYNTIRYNTTQCIAIQYNTIHYNTIEYNTLRHITMQHNTIQQNTIKYNTKQYDTIQYNTIQHNTKQYNTI